VWLIGFDWLRIGTGGGRVLHARRNDYINRTLLSYYVVTCFISAITVTLPSLDLLEVSSGLSSVPHLFLL
jgi:hypothetical protein